MSVSKVWKGIGLGTAIIILLGIVTAYVIFWPLTRIKIVSDVSGYNVKLDYGLALSNYLKETKFFTKNQVKLRNRDVYGQEVTVKKIVIHLNKEKYKSNGFIDEQRNLLYSTGENYSKGILELNIGIKSNYWDEDMIKLNSIVNLEFSLAVGELTDPVNFYKDNNLNSKQINNFITVSKSK